MKLEQQVVSLELAKKLKELGVPQKSIFWWVANIEKLMDENPDDIMHDERGVISHPIDTGKKYHPEIELRFYGNSKPVGRETYPAYTVAELGELLPTEQNDRLGFFSGRAINGWFCEVKNYGVMPFERLHVELQHDIEANARAAMLIYLIENNLIKV